MNRDAWIRNVLLRPGRECSWKKHARTGTALREVLGMLDGWATRYAPNEGGADPLATIGQPNARGRRFIMVHRATILKQCFKGKRKESPNYSIQHLKRILEELRAQHIISKYFDTNDGRYGFVVAPHDSLCHVRNGVCVLPDRASTRAHDEPQQEPMMSLNVSPVPVIDEPQREPQHEPGKSFHESDFIDFTDAEIAKWFADGMQPGGPIRCIRLSDVSEHPKNPSYPDFSQEALEHHEQFLKSKAQKRQQEQPQRQERVSEVVSSREPRTAEAKPKAKQPGRKRDVLSPLEFDRAKTEDSLAEEKAEYESRPLCAKCGFKHYPDKACIQITESKRKR